MSAAFTKKVPATNRGRTRRSIIKSTATKLLENSSHLELTLAQITEAAGIPTSVFYHYFENKQELVAELLDDLFEEYQARMDECKPFGTFERGILQSNYQLLSIYETHKGLIRCTAESRDPIFLARWRSNVTERRRHIAEGLLEFAGESAAERSITQLRAIAHTLSAMTEGFAWEYCILGNSDLTKALPNISVAAEFLTTLWARSLFLAQPSYVSAEQFVALLGLRDRDTRQ